MLTAFTLIFMIVVVPLWPMASNAEQYMTSYIVLSDPLTSLGTDVPTLVALIVCLIPTTIGALLAAGRHRLNALGYKQYYSLGSLVLDSLARRATRGGRVVPITSAELTVLALLVR